MIRGLLLVLALAGCKRAPEEPTGSTPVTVVDPDGAWQQTSVFGGKTDASGILEVTVEVGPNDSAFQVSATSPSDFAGLERVIDPNGDVVLRWQDWWNNDDALTDAFFGWARTVAFNWPVREEDGPLTPGTWTVELYTSKANGDYVKGRLDGTVWAKADADLRSGDVPVHIVWAENQDKPRVVEAVHESVERWRAIWATQGLNLVESYHTSNLVKDLDFAYDVNGSEDVRAVVADLPPGALVLVIGETVDGDSDTFGLAAGIPGTLEATSLTWVLVGWLTHAGPNADFDAEEIAILGETMAHEVGHYCGLYHPIDFDNGFYDVLSWDALEDTERCTEWQGCEAAMADNVMYPYPVCDFQSCTPAGHITDDQAGVWHRYLGVK